MEMHRSKRTEWQEIEREKEGLYETEGGDGMLILEPSHEVHIYHNEEKFRFKNYIQKITACLSIIITNSALADLFY